ncbi:hypothetical protein BDW22DRAFT_180547 [Trametopsis cervina]|nr:hypothetical protein BDW22DRAFT_180547 [Trametopsis cervina]
MEGGIFARTERQALRDSGMLPLVLSRTEPLASQNWTSTKRSRDSSQPNVPYNSLSALELLRRGMRITSSFSVINIGTSGARWGTRPLELSRARWKSPATADLPITRYGGRCIAAVGGPSIALLESRTPRTLQAYNMSLRCHLMRHPLICNIVALASGGRPAVSSIPPHLLCQ